MVTNRMLKAEISAVGDHSWGSAGSGYTAIARFTQVEVTSMPTFS